MPRYSIPSDISTIKQVKRKHPRHMHAHKTAQYESTQINPTNNQPKHGRKEKRKWYLFIRAILCSAIPIHSGYKKKRKPYNARSPPTKSGNQNKANRTKEPYIHPSTPIHTMLFLWRKINPIPSISISLKKTTTTRQKNKMMLPLFLSPQLATQQQMQQVNPLPSLKKESPQEGNWKKTRKSPFL